MERADALAEERIAITNYMRNTLITNELKFKEVRREGEGRAKRGLRRVWQVGHLAAAAAAAAIGNCRDKGPE